MHQKLAPTISYHDIFSYTVGGKEYVDISVCVLIDKYKAIYRDRIECVRFFISFAWMAIDAHFQPISITLGWTNEPWYHRTNIIFVDSFLPSYAINKSRDWHLIPCRSFASMLNVYRCKLFILNYIFFSL